MIRMTFALIVLLFLFGCDSAEQATSNNQSNNSAKTSQANTSQAITPEQVAKPASEEVKKIWPFMGEDSKNDATVSENLLTKNYYVVVDGSGSMRHHECSNGSSKMSAAKAALHNFGKSIPSEANLGVSVFMDSQIKELISISKKDLNQYNNAVESIYESGGTPLKSSIEFAYKKLTDQAIKQLGYGEYHMIVVTDGHANKGEEPTEIVNKVISTTPILVHTIGFCIGEDHALNQPGRTYYKSANNPDELLKGLESVLAESQSFTVTDFN